MVASTITSSGSPRPDLQHFALVTTSWPGAGWTEEQEQRPATFCYDNLTEGDGEPPARELPREETPPDRLELGRYFLLLLVLVRLLLLLVVVRLLVLLVVARLMYLLLLIRWQVQAINSPLPQNKSIY